MVAKHRTFLYVLIALIVICVGALVYLQHQRSEGFQVEEGEESCVFVNSRGIMKSCKHYNPNMKSSESHTPIDVNAIHENESVYICADALKDFASNTLPALKTSIVLVSGDADKTIQLSDAYAQAIVNSDKIKRWYAQNLVDTHPKLVQMPIGLDYHTIASNTGHFWGAQQSPLAQETAIVALQKTAHPLRDRSPRIYANFHFELERGDRREAHRDIPSDLVDYQTAKSDRATTHANQLKYAFVASPSGVGMDCHRTWEALALGCIPIMKRSGLATLFEGMPVLIVDQWKDITPELLQSTVETYADQPPSWEHPKMRLDSWVRQINIV